MFFNELERVFELAACILLVHEFALAEEACGSTNVLFPKISDGVPASYGEIPWQVRIDGSPKYCGGTIIGASWILSAAHCFITGSLRNPREVSANLISIKVGALYLDREVDGQFTASVDRIVIHPMYNAAARDYDFALVHLSRPLQWSDTVKPACVPDNCSDEPPLSTICLISGWGTNSSEGMIPQNQLQKAIVPLADRRRCQDSMNRVLADNGLNPITLTDRMVCAGSGKSSPDACQGDSGGPMACRSRSTSQFFIIGVISYGYGCGYDGTFGIYSRTCRVAEWIKQVVSGTPVATAITVRPNRPPQALTTRAINVPNCIAPSSNISIPSLPVTTSSTELPWQVRLNIRMWDATTNMTCGAAIISRHLLLTSSQCAPSNSTRISVKTGSGQSLGNVKRVFRHPRFDADTFDYDFSILQLENELVFNGNVAAICLAESCDSDDIFLAERGNLCVASGWSSIFTAKQVSPILRKAGVGLKTAAQCQNWLRELFTDRSLCVQDLSSKTARCQTDIGGPLVCRGTSGSFYLQGIASYAPSTCDDRDSIIVYGKTCQIKQWISNLPLSLM